MAATIHDVAVAAGVSTATVSRALHADARVAVRTRIKVEEAAERLAYRPSAAAARLATGRHGVVAVVSVGGLRTAGAELINGACSVLAEHDVDCALDLGVHRAVTRTLRGMAGRADAVLLVPDRPLDESDLADVGLPLVVVGGAVDLPAQHPVVDVDRIGAADLAAGHLRAMGYTQIAVIGESGGMGRSRAAEVVRAVSEGAGLTALMPPTLVEGVGVEPADRAVAALLAGARRPDAVVCLGDRAARGAHRALLRHHLVPGQDVGVVGIGTEQILDELDVSTVVEPLHEVGAEGARQALRLVGVLSGPAHGAVIRPQLAVGSSTQRPSRRAGTGWLCS